LSYCIAFSADGCTDVTRRYVRDASAASKRNRCSEGELIHMAEDAREDEEFRRNVIESLAYTISRILPGGDAAKGSSRSDPDAQKAAEARREAEILRTSAGRNASNMPRGQGQ
jgi:peptide-N4-(N-acetyl-beta-glucosaminyl)asparagine amidase